jgi:hypothetical protein
MKKIEQLKNDFSLYFQEIDRCEHAKCYWALLHMLLTLPDVCASLEAGNEKVGDRYVRWCKAYFPNNPAISASDRYQMRNALLHHGSTTADNLGKDHHTQYFHFSYVDPDTSNVTIHGRTDQGDNVLNVHVLQLSAETKEALDRWFITLQKDPAKLSRVTKNIARLTRIQKKKISFLQPDGSLREEWSLTSSST